MPGKHVRFDTNVQYTNPPTPSPSFSLTSLPSSYGPTTPPQNAYTYLPMVPPVGGAPALHPLLQFTPGQAPHLLWDVTLPCENVKPMSKIMSPTVLNEPATLPAVSSMTLVHPRLQWEIEILPAEGTCVRVLDVLAGIYKSLRQQATGPDYEALPTRAAQNEVTDAFTHRWSKIPDPRTKTMEKSKGLKRVDFLGSMVAFGGIFKAPNGPNHWALVVS